jgi:hypothetical protein
VRATLRTSHCVNLHARGLVPCHRRRGTVICRYDTATLPAPTHLTSPQPRPNPTHSSTLSPDAASARSWSRLRSTRAG